MALSNLAVHLVDPAEDTIEDDHLTQQGRRLELVVNVVQGIELILSSQSQKAHLFHWQRHVFWGVRNLSWYANARGRPFIDHDECVPDCVHVSERRVL